MLYEKGVLYVCSTVNHVNRNTTEQTGLIFCKEMVRIKRWHIFDIALLFKMASSLETSTLNSLKGSICLIHKIRKAVYLIKNLITHFRKPITIWIKSKSNLRNYYCLRCLLKVLIWSLWWIVKVGIYIHFILQPVLYGFLFWYV